MPDLFSVHSSLKAFKQDAVSRENTQAQLKTNKDCTEEPGRRMLVAGPWCLSVRLLSGQINGHRG